MEHSRRIEPQCDLAPATDRPEALEQVLRHLKGHSGAVTFEDLPGALNAFDGGQQSLSAARAAPSIAHLAQQRDDGHLIVGAHRLLNKTTRGLLTDRSLPVIQHHVGESFAHGISSSAAATVKRRFSMSNSRTWCRTHDTIAFSSSLEELQGSIAGACWRAHHCRGSWEAGRRARDCHRPRVASDLGQPSVNHVKFVLGHFLLTLRDEDSLAVGRQCE